MASTLHYLLFQDPDLLDIVDEEWEREELADEGMASCSGEGVEVASAASEILMNITMQGAIC